jgi:enoyl-CoA hydratase
MLRAGRRNRRARTIADGERIHKSEKSAMAQAEQQNVLVRVDEREGGSQIAYLTINNARKLNSLNSALMRDVVAICADLARRQALRAVVVTGAGDKAFVGGADIDEMVALDPNSARNFITLLHGCCNAVREMPVPVIARIQGYALGGGLELAAACDLRVASDTAVFGMPEVKLGIPSVIEAALLPALVGWGRARHMLLLGESFGAADAATWGLIERVVPAHELDDAVESYIQSILRAGARAVRLQKKLIRTWEDLPLQAAIEAGIDAFVAAWESDEPRRAMSEFQSLRRKQASQADRAPTGLSPERTGQ